jgi:Galactose oxidase, central domain
MQKMNASSKGSTDRTITSSAAARAFTWILMVSLTLVGVAGNSAAQTMPNLVRMMRERSRQDSSRPSQTPQPLLSAPTWSLLVPPVTDPDLWPARGQHSGVYDPGSNTLIVFGGVDGNDNLQNDVLIETDANGSGGFSGGTLSELYVSFPLPPARIFHTAVYDQTNNRMIVFGGCADQECLLPLNDTWVLTNANGSGGTTAWTELNPTGSLPSPRGSQGTVYDATNNRMIVFSGDNDLQQFSDVWVLTNANGLGGTPAWTQLSPTGGPPDAIDGSTAVYDPTSNAMIVFGGGECLNSVWTLSNANGLGGTPAWTNLIANGKAGSPPGRISAQAVYDSTSNRMTIYGGQGEGGLTNPNYHFQAFGDVWVLTHANGSGGGPVWAQLHPKWEGDGNIMPGGRIFFSGVRDPGTNSLIIFGGETIESTYNTAWVLSHANGL